MSSDDKALDETSTHIVDAVLNDEIEDEFVKSLISTEQRQKTPSPPPAPQHKHGEHKHEEPKDEETVAIIDTDPISETSIEEHKHHEERKYIIIL